MQHFRWDKELKGNPEASRRLWVEWKGGNKRSGDRLAAHLLGMIATGKRFRCLCCAAGVTFSDGQALMGEAVTLALRNWDPDKGLIEPYAAIYRMKVFIEQGHRFSGAITLPKRVGYQFTRAMKGEPCSVDWAISGDEKRAIVESGQLPGRLMSDPAVIATHCCDGAPSAESNAAAREIASCVEAVAEALGTRSEQRLGIMRDLAAKVLGSDETYVDIAARYDITNERVRQLDTVFLAAVRKRLADLCPEEAA